MWSDVVPTVKFLSVPDIKAETLPELQSQKKRTKGKLKPPVKMLLCPRGFQPDLSPVTGFYWPGVTGPAPDDMAGRTF